MGTVRWQDGRVTQTDPDRADRSPKPDRRSFLRTAGLAAATGLGVAGCAPEAITGNRGSAQADAANADGTASGSIGSATIAFRADRQLGLTQPVRSAGAVAAFDVLVLDRAALIELFKTLSAEIERLMAAEPADELVEVQPPLDAGLLGPDPEPSGLTIIMSVGASLFDSRFGLIDRRPVELQPMPRFSNDRFIDADRVGGDVAFTIMGDSHQAVSHALQQLVRRTDRQLRLRWLQSGYNDVSDLPRPGIAPARNLLGFKDGTSNLDINDAAVLDEHVWVNAESNEPPWAVGGSYQAVRVIRMLIEFWSTVALVRQELIIGRDKDTGAPLGQTSELDEPTFVAEPSNVEIPPVSHMRRANPRTGEARILRRGFSYTDGVDGQGLLNQGLLFLAYQKSLEDGFIATQRRLDGEPLEDYIKPVGGGFFFVLPGPGTGAGGWLGQSLLMS